ncbi:MAG: hypothetical protein ABEK29_03195 [Bradymonadaceae bacterium]
MTEEKIIAQVGNGADASDVVLTLDKSELSDGRLGLDLGNDKVWIDLDQFERAGLSVSEK